MITIFNKPIIDTEFYIWKKYSVKIIFTFSPRKWIFQMKLEILNNFTNNLQYNIKNTYFIENLTSSIENKINTINNSCVLFKNNLKNQMQLFDFENGLIFFINLI